MIRSSFVEYVLGATALAYVGSTISLNPDGLAAMAAAVTVPVLPAGGGDEPPGDSAPIPYPMAYLASPSGSMSVLKMWVSDGGKNIPV